MMSFTLELLLFVPTGINTNKYQILVVVYISFFYYNKIDPAACQTYSGAFNIVRTILYLNIKSISSSGMGDDDTIQYYIYSLNKIIFERTTKFGF